MAQMAQIEIIFQIQAVQKILDFAIFKVCTPDNKKKRGDSRVVSPRQIVTKYAQKDCRGGGERW